MKPVLVHYINIGNLDNLEVSDYIERIKMTLTYDYEYHCIFLPVREQSTRIEILNPQIINEKDEKNKFISNLNNLKKQTEDMMKNFPFLNKKLLLIEKI